MKTKTVEYKSGKTLCKSYIAYEERMTPKPVVLIAPTWRGVDKFAKEKAHEMAKLGFVGFACDLYGNGQTGSNDSEADALMAPLFLDRPLLRERIVSAYEYAETLEFVDPDKKGAIGFCFGGLCVIELMRSGAELQGIVSIHGVLGDVMYDKKAKLAPNAPKYHSSLLVLHGINDPLVPLEQIIKLQAEVAKAKIDWQVHIFGNAGHAFTNPEANKNGVCFDPLANERSKILTEIYLTERFK